MAHQRESVDVTLALTLSNLISLVRGPSVVGLGTGGQGQLPTGWLSPRLGWPGRKPKASGRRDYGSSFPPGEAGSSILHAQCCPQASGRCPLPSSFSSGVWPISDP